MKSSGQPLSDLGRLLESNQSSLLLENFTSEAPIRSAGLHKMVEDNAPEDRCSGEMYK